MTETIQSTLRECAAVKKTKRNNALPQHIQGLIGERNNTGRAYQRRRSDELRTKKNQLSTEIKREIAKWKNNQWNQKLEKLNTRDNSLWSMTKAMTRKTSSIPPLKDQDDIAISDEEKAEALAKNYEKVHKLTADYGDEEIVNITAQIAQHIKETEHTTSDIRLTSPSEIRKIIKKFKNNKAPGLDNIPNVALKNLDSKALIQLTHIYNACLKLAYFPNSWKEAVILPFHKSGKDPKETSSYRPISLLRTLSKILENIISNRLKEEGKIEEKLNEDQYGCRTKRNTVKQLLRVTYDITHNFNINKSTAALLLDSEKAFDTVWHDRLITRMEDMGFKLHLIKIVASFLEDRTFKVKVKNSYSTIKTIAAGVPQGSILGPILYIIYNNDIPKNSKTKLAIFADDTATYSHSWKKSQAVKNVKEHADELEIYFENSKTKINAAKTEFIIFTQKKKEVTPENITVFDTNIKRSECVKYLGVKLDSKLNFNNHVETTIAKVSKAIGALYPLLGQRSIVNSKNKLLIYKIILKPALLYACPVWGNKVSNSTMQKLQRIQNKCLRMALNKDRFTRIAELHEEAKIEEIKTQIEKLSTSFYQSLNIASLDYITQANAANIPYKVKHKLPQLGYL